MHLKALTLRGFKSFASATTLRFEPGIVCVVGPNGSGKSNVVDALAWVMGEQGAKSLRGGKMDDVIFAGTAGRAPLGRAEVALTIDNTDGALPIDYTEVTISRTMFRAGGSEYAINGSPVRLLDIQELLSDSGIGREMHVIVGQGQLDAILSASPEERRGFIEEAAGVLKHRKRKEKALRKLEAMSANLARVTDLTGELRRQLKPLGKQAEVARRAAVVQADLRDSRLRLLADDLVALRSALAAEAADEDALRRRRETLEADLAAAREREAALDEALRAASPQVAAAQETWYSLSSLRERLRGTASLAAERARNAGRSGEEERRGREPDELEREAAGVREREAALTAELAVAREALAAATAVRQSAEAALAEEERAVARALRAAADRREGLARVTGQVNAGRTRLAAVDAELGRLDGAVAEARSRAEEAAAALAELEEQASGVDAGEVDLDALHEEAAATLEQAVVAVRELTEEQRAAQGERDRQAARTEALALGLARKDGASELASSSGLPGILGPLAACVGVEPGAQTAVAAALGRAADAVAVDGLPAAVAALRWLRDTDAGQAGVILAGPAAAGTSPGTGALDAPEPLVVAGAAPAGTRWVAAALRAPTALHAALGQLLEGALLVADLDEAARVVAAHPALWAVTPDGDVVGSSLTVGGSSSAPSLIEVQAALDAAAAALASAQARADAAEIQLVETRAGAEVAKQAESAALDRLHESDARMAALAEALGRLGAAVRSASAEAGRLEAARAAAQASRENARTGLAELEERLAAATEEPADDEPAPDERERLRDAAEEARSAETDARLAVRTAEERVRGLAGRADALDRQAAGERAARARAAERAQRREREARVAHAVGAAAALALDRLEGSLSAAGAERNAVEARRAATEAELVAVRASRTELASALDGLVSAVHRDELVKAEGRARVEALEAKALEEHGLDADTLVVEYGPDQPVPPSPLAPGEEREVEPEPVPYDRDEQTRRMRAAERLLALLGRVNPLALEEFSALEERHRFLTEQLEDLKAARRSLLDIVREVDERVEQVFSEAFADTAREFEGVFARLFPGGEGRLVLTDPSDMLTTGIEVEARPPGKKIKRLSLLSGGERSLVAVAILVSIFKARPSPFYILDEVEAALDDTNLSRLLTLYEELRDSSQLIVITHQKRTMEIADALYGVTMRGDGVSTVVSQRLREDAPA